VAANKRDLCAQQLHVGIDPSTRLGSLQQIQGLVEGAGLEIRPRGGEGALRAA
jgi:hypothetical protein